MSQPNEVALVFDADGNTIYWHEPDDRTAVSIPDSKTLWDILWEHREKVAGIAHTHPFEGSNSIPSHIDMGTFKAIEMGLGKPLMWPIVSHMGMIVIGSDGRPINSIKLNDIEELRQRSGMTKEI